MIDRMRFKLRVRPGSSLGKYTLIAGVSADRLKGNTSVVEIPIVRNGEKVNVLLDEVTVNIRKGVLAILLIAVVGLPLYYHYQGSQRPTIEFDGVTWTQVLHWNFKDGFYPGGRGWGNWSIVDGKLQIEADSSGEESVYILPASHGGDFLLETKVRIVRGSDLHYVAAQLITRDSEQVNYESGLVILPEMDQAIVRHMSGKIDYVYTAFPINMTIEYNEWYIIKLMAKNGIVKAFVNDVEIYASDSAFPAGEYREPHLAVRYGVARFEWVRVYILSA